MTFLLLVHWRPYSLWDADCFATPNRSQICKPQWHEGQMCTLDQFSVWQKQANTLRKDTASHTRTAIGCQASGVGRTKPLLVFLIMQYFTFSKLKATAYSQWSQRASSRANTTSCAVLPDAEMSEQKTDEAHGAQTCQQLIKLMVFMRILVKETSV